MHCCIVALLYAERQHHEVESARQAEDLAMLRSASFLVHKKLEMHQTEITQTEAKLEAKEAEVRSSASPEGWG